MHAMAPPCSQCRQGAGVAASRSWSPGMTTNHACTQPFVTSPTWESPRCPHPTGQEKHPEHQPIHEDFIPSGLKGSGEGRGKSTRRSNVGSKMRSFFGQKKKEERKAGREGRKEEGVDKYIWRALSLLFPSLRFIIHSNILEALKNPAIKKPTSTFSTSTSRTVGFCLSL